MKGYMAEDLQQLRPADGLTFEFEPGSRICTVIMVEHLALIPKRIEVPFAHLKEAVAEILQFECELKIAELPAGTKPKDYPPGVRGKIRCAEILMAEAKGEQAASTLTDRSNDELDEAARKAAQKAKIELIT
jgi:hypothetical protein